MVLIGINDMSWPGHVFAPDLDHAGRRRADRRLPAARRPGACPQHPHHRGDADVVRGRARGYAVQGLRTPEKDRLRQEINAWVRTSGTFDAVVDLDAALRDPDDRLRLRAAFDSGDHLHASDRGNQAIADAIDVGVLLGPR